MSKGSHQRGTESRQQRRKLLPSLTRTVAAGAFVQLKDMANAVTYDEFAQLDAMAARTDLGVFALRLFALFLFLPLAFLVPSLCVPPPIPLLPPSSVSDTEAIISTSSSESPCGGCWDGVVVGVVG